MNDIQKAQAARILSCYDIPTNDLEKGGKSAQVGETHSWNGKNYKKQANGKWVEVSEGHKNTKKEHLEWEETFRVKAQKKRDEQRHYAAGANHDQAEYHKEQASKLSDKEYSDEEVGIKKED